jgi:putative hydrolase
MVLNKFNFECTKGSEFVKIIADTHCHTIASTHAYSTIYENVYEAEAAGLEFLAITDHSGDMPGAPGTWYFENLKILPKNVNGVSLLTGIEANVLNIGGEIDVPADLSIPLDWVVASIHECVFFGDHGFEECTQIWLNVAKNPLINVIGHSGVADFAYDYETVIPEFGKNAKLVEINNSSFNIRRGSQENCRKIAQICKKYEVPVIVNSDAHFCKQVGRVDEALKLLKSIDFPEELIINADVKRFRSYLEEHTGFYESGRAN